MKKALFLLAVMAVPFMHSAARADQTSVSMLNELLQGELSAVETYRQAIEKVGSVPGSQQLLVFKEGHSAAAKALEGLVTAQGGVPAKTSGTWGTWAKTVMGSAKILGDTAALKALKEGEEHGAKEYEEALKNDNVAPEIKAAIRDTLLPAQRRHVDAIDKLMQNT